MNTTSLIRSISVGMLLLANAAFANGGLPSFIQRHIDRTVTEASVIFIGTVTEAPDMTSDSPTFRIEVDDVLMGELGSSMTLSVRGFAEQDLQPGTKLLVPLRSFTSRLIHTQRYEVVVEGNIREYAQKTYVGRMKKAIISKASRFNSAVASKSL
jgi:hypothetical protein